MAVRLLLGIGVAALASCSSDGRNPATSIASSTSIDGKVTPPVDVSLVILDRLEIGAPFHVTLTFVTHEGTNAVRASVRGSGVVTVVESGAIHPTDSAADRQMAVDATVRLDGVGTGEISGTVDVVNDRDGVQSSRTDSMSVLATSSEVLTGRGGLLQLRLDHLEHERSRGLVSEADYVRQRDEILGGGSTTGS